MLEINVKAVFSLVMERHSDFWGDKADELRRLINTVVEEISSFEAVVETPLSAEDAGKVKAIWVLSGIGTYDKPITDTVGDQTYKDKLWAQNSDRIRIDRAAKLSAEIKQMSGEEPFFIYNGIKMQDEDLLRAINQGQVSISESRLFIPPGEINRTLDQVQNLKLPEINFEAGAKIGIVTHAPHLSRVLRMVNRFKPFPPGIQIKLFPIVFPDVANEADFAAAEIMGVIGYVSRGQASVEPYPFEV